MDRRAILLGVGGSVLVLAYLVAHGPAYESVAIVLATLLPAGLVLYGGAARRRAEDLRSQQGLTQDAYERSELANQDLHERVAELMTLNELAAAAGSTLDRDELLDRSLVAVTRHLRFDRALILLADTELDVLTDGRSVGGSPEMTAAITDLRLPLDLTTSHLVQLYQADGPLLFRHVDEDPDERNRTFARMMEVTSFLGTPLVAKGRTVGVLAVDNRASGRDVRPGDGPLLYTVGSLIAAAIENARLYGEVESQKEALERRVVERTAALAVAIEEAQAARVAAEEASATKSAFLSSVSHELRTPLTSVVGFSRLIRRRLDEVVFPAVPTGEPKRDRAMRQVSDNLGIIIEEGERLTALINDTLDLAKIEAGRMEWRREPVDVGEVIARADGRDRIAPRRVRARDGGRRGGRPAARPRRPRPAHPGRHQPDLERGQVHPAGDDHLLGALERRRRSGDRAGQRRRHGRGHRSRGSGAGVRAVRPGRRHPHRHAPWHGPRACRSAARSSSTTAAGCGSTRRSGAGRGSRSPCRSRSPRPPARTGPIRPAATASRSRSRHRRTDRPDSRRGLHRDGAITCASWGPRTARPAGRAWCPGVPGCAPLPLSDTWWPLGSTYRIISAIGPNRIPRIAQTPARRPNRGATW